jgi:dUTP pyrophosphatase
LLYHAAVSIRLPDFPQLPGAPDLELQRQPAGVDFSVASVAVFASAGALDFSNALRQLPQLETLVWADLDEPNMPACLDLSPGAYLVTYNEEIAVPLDSAGIILPRSSLMRCGAVLHSALWDPGYRGRGQGLLTVYAPLRLYRDARIGQFVLFSLETAASLGYSGQYQGENLSSK